MEGTINSLLDMEALQAEAERLTASTKEQRRALHRLGYSDHFISRYCHTKVAAAKIISQAIETMTLAKQ